MASAWQLHEEKSGKKIRKNKKSPRTPHARTVTKKGN